VSIDLIRGLRNEFLANVDYRIYTDNVDWDALRELRGDRFSPRAINRTLFIDEWDDAVVARTREAWEELGGTGRGIVFCGTIDHAERVAARINALGFTHAEPIYSRSSAGQVMSPIERNRKLWDFADGRIGILCSVDVLNEGVDVPDVNLVVFQRVTHSRRIFVQQLGRGLRIAPGKERVIVLDFVSDIRRFAAGLELQRGLEDDGPAPGHVFHVSLPSSVSFRRANGEDEEGANFLNEWLGDLQEIEDAGEDVSVLRYPPQNLIPQGR
jgi:superfamily II DNA or RNA helicase